MWVNRYSLLFSTIRFLPPPPRSRGNLVIYRQYMCWRGACQSGLCPKIPGRICVGPLTTRITMVTMSCMRLERLVFMETSKITVCISYRLNYHQLYYIKMLKYSFMILKPRALACFSAASICCSILVSFYTLNIPACEYRESGKMETAIPAKWKPVIGAPIM